MKIIRQILAVLGRIMFFGFSVQIVLGLLWMCGNFTKVQQFGESTFYMEASKSLLCDEYTGALYPILLMLTRGMEELLSIPHTYILYVIQLGVAWFAGSKFLENGRKSSKGHAGNHENDTEILKEYAKKYKKYAWKIWGSLALLTFPMAMQCHMAILPNSLASSCFLLEMSYLLRMLRGDITAIPGTELGNRERNAFQAADVAKACACWLLAALLLPEYLYLGAVPLVLFFGYEVFRGCVRKNKRGKKQSNAIRSICHHGILIVAFAGMIVGTNCLTQVEGAYGRPQKSLEAAFFRRVAWMSVTEDYEAWPKDMKACFTAEEITEIAAYADNMERVLQSRLEEKLGADRAKVIYCELGKYMLQNNSRRILHQTAWDLVGYTLPTVTTQLLLTGRGYDSYVGRNYDVMRQQAPKLTSIYLDYSCWWFVAGVGCMAVMVLGRMFVIILEKKQKPRQKHQWQVIVLCVFSAGGMVLWYTLQGAGMWDYKNALFVGQLWLAAMWSAGYDAGNIGIG